ncbi:LuxR C-terminal-related transcriptional regulator, partial [Klebsiella quasipneumoniae]
KNSLNRLIRLFAGKKSAQIREILISESAWEEMTCLFAPSLSPTEHAILRYMSWGYSLSEIAVQLNRNIKTIRAHKFNAMTKLGVRSDIGLLNAADILLHLPINGPTSAVKQVA